MEEELKKCSNCSRAAQPISSFINIKGKECSTCLKCREKGKKHDFKPERRKYHNDIQKENEYYKVWRAKQLEERPEEYREHNNKVQALWKIKNSEHVRQWYKTHVNTRLDSIKRSAQTRGIEWNLEDEQAKLMMTTECIYCNHIDLEVRVNGIDRLDSSKSYTMENCRPCCKNCNYMKGSLDPISFIQICKKISECSKEFPEIQQCLEHKKTRKTIPEQFPVKLLEIHTN